MWRSSPDLVIVGGGDLIRIDRTTVAYDHLRLPSDRRPTMLSRLRGQFYARRRMPRGPGPWLPEAGWVEGVPTVFASVGVQPIGASAAIQDALSNVSAAWVRLPAGRDRLAQAGLPAPSIVVAPDAVFASPSLRDPERLRRRGRALLAERCGSSYSNAVLVHAADFHGWGAARVAAMLEALRHLRLVVLPLGTYSGEDRSLASAARAQGVPCLPLMTADDTTSLLAAGAALVTTSMHAAIVAACVGTPVLVPSEVRKTADAMASCPEPPPVGVIGNSDDIAATVGEVVGQRTPLPSEANARAAVAAMREIMRAGSRRRPGEPSGVVDLTSRDSSPRAWNGLSTK